MKIHIKTLWWFFSLFVHPTSPATYLMSNANWAHFLPLCGRGCVARRRLCMAIRGGTQCQARFKGTNRSECCYGMSLEWGSLDDKLSCHAQAHEYVCNVFSQGFTVLGFDLWSKRQKIHLSFMNEMQVPVLQSIWESTKSYWISRQVLF